MKAIAGQGLVACCPLQVALTPREDGLWFARLDAPWVASAQAWFVRVTMLDGAPEEHRDVAAFARVASWSRISDAVQSVAAPLVRPASAPPFPHDPGGDWIEVDVAQECWRGALREQTVAIFLPPPVWSIDRARVELWALCAPAPPACEELTQRVDAKIAEIDAALAAQARAIQQHPRFAALESVWRALWFLVERVDFGENIRVEVLSVSRADLRDDFEDSPDAASSGLHAIVGARAHEPYGLIVGEYAFGPDASDLWLLERIAAVAERTLAPFVAAAAPSMFSIYAWGRLSALHRVDDLSWDLLYAPRWAGWRAFRERPHARYVGLALPRFLLRAAHADRAGAARSPASDGAARPDDALWGNAAVAFATRVADSFAKYRRCSNVILDDGGVEGIEAESGERTVEYELTGRQELAIAGLGFVALGVDAETRRATFRAAGSAKAPGVFGEGDSDREAAASDQLSTQLPYLFEVVRYAHYLRAIAFDEVARCAEAASLEGALQCWIGRYVTDSDDPAPGVKSRRPIRRAKVTVDDVQEQPGRYRVRLDLSPLIRTKGTGPYIRLSVVGWVDK